MTNTNQSIKKIQQELLLTEKEMQRAVKNASEKVRRVAYNRGIKLLSKQSGIPEKQIKYGQRAFSRISESEGLKIWLGLNDYPLYWSTVRPTKEENEEAKKKNIKSVFNLKRSFDEQAISAELDRLNNQMLSLYEVEIERQSKNILRRT